MYIVATVPRYGIGYIQLYYNTQYDSMSPQYWIYCRSI